MNITRELICAVVLAGALSLPAAAWSANMRSSANYAMQFDCIASGGGAMSSASYSQPQTLIGQPVIWNNYTSASYDWQPVGVFLFNSLPTAVRDWHWY